MSSAATLTRLLDQLYEVFFHRVGFDLQTGAASVGPSAQNQNQSQSQSQQLQTSYAAAVSPSASAGAAAGFAERKRDLSTAGKFNGGKNPPAATAAASPGGNCGLLLLLSTRCCECLRLWNALDRTRICFVICSSLCFVFSRPVCVLPVRAGLQMESVFVALVVCV